nr:regulatory protein RecX [Corticibacter populi]
MKGTGLSLQARALRALAGREYSRAELRRKLVLHVQAEGDDATGAAAERPGPDTPDALEALLDKLQARGLLSDERAAEALVRQKAPRMGSVRLRQALQAKGLDKELVQEALAPLQETELERARQVWQAKFGGVDLAALPWPEQQKMRAKQMRFLLTRGFAMDVVRQLLP